MRYVGLIVEHIGEQTRNRRSDVTPTSGVSDNEILQYLTNAQRVIQSQVLRQVGHTSFFNATITTPLVANKKTYSLPGDVFYNHKVKRVRYSKTGLPRDYYTLQPVSSFRFTGDQDIQHPSAYSVGNGVIALNGIPTTGQGTLEITYVRRLDRLETRRAKVLSTTDDGTNYLTVTLDTAIDIDSERISKYVGDYFCANNVKGEVCYHAAFIQSYDVATHVITLANTPLSAGTIDNSCYIVLGEYATTHSKLPDECEQFLIEFTDWKIKKGESSEDAFESNQEMVSVNDDIISQFANFTDMQEVMTFDPMGDFT
jgi:hypothetical protein